VPSLLALCAAGAATGVPYGLLFRRLDQSVDTALGWGLWYGFLWWANGPLTLVPLLGGQGLRWSASEAAGEFGGLVALLLHGACLGIAFHFLQAPYRGPWTVGHGGEDRDEGGDEGGDEGEVLVPEPAPAAASSALLVTVVLLVLIVLTGAGG
jgi:hypothetical protein